MPYQKGKALDVALKLIARRDYSRYMLKEKLLKKEYSLPEVEEALNQLEEYKYLDDERFSKSLVRYRAELSNWGKGRIKQDFYKKGIAPDLAQEALELYELGELSTSEEEVDWVKNAETLLLKRFGTYEHLEQKERARRINFLLRRGFSQSEALTALERTKFSEY